MASRRFQRYRKPPPAAAFIPTPPSAEYLSLSEVTSRRLSAEDDEPTPRKLLVLDLNGTLVLRSPRTYNAPRSVMARPYYETFRKYVFREGSHLDVMVWSSAQPHSVNSMLDVFFQSDRKHLVGIWARDTLGLAAENYSQKVQTIKDLNIVWNAPAGLPPPVKITPPPPMAVLTNDPSSIPGYDPNKPPPDIKAMIHTSMQLMPPRSPEDKDSAEVDRTGYFSTPEVRIDDPIPGLGGSDPVEEPASSGLYSALNTLLLDDSALKAHLQPHNHLTLPEYTAELRSRDVRRQAALEEMLDSEKNALGSVDGVIDRSQAEEEAEAVDSGKEATSAGDKSSSFGSSKQNFKALRAAPFDKTLIAVVGVLSEIQYESSIVGWMRAGGMRPSPEEMARVAALVGEDPARNSSIEGENTAQAEEGGEVAGEGRSSKRSSSVMSGGGGRRRKRTNTGSDVKVGDTSVEEEIEMFEEPVTAEPPTIEEQAELLPPSSSSPTSASAPKDDTLAAPTHQDTKQQKRKQKRSRQKATYPATHPLSADDSYPFFFNADPKAESKLWFQDREVYAYWVRRGLLALQECGIELEHGVFDS
ncbi:hypothetical protein BDV93DRAFT_473423 [Ceratobasidium sp. AG-I]|nr:hypothetical protein BDV93DRAFT_473423 [Ceratobasidium sp. AG-I]